MSSSDRRNARSQQLREAFGGAEFDELVALAAHLCAAPMALITVLDGERVWAKAKHGVGQVELTEEQSFCVHLLENQGQVLEVEDTHLDARFAQLKMVTGEPKLRFYAGAPMITETGEILGGVCVLDTKPRKLDSNQLRFLRTLSRQVVVQFELQRQNQQLLEMQQSSNRALADLRSSEERFQLAMTGYPGGVWDLQVNTGEMVYSPGFCRMLARRDCGAPQSLEASFEYVHPKDRSKIEQAFAAHFDDPAKKFEVEYRMRTHTGDYRWFISNGQVVRDDEGNAERMVGFTRDITDRKRIARAVTKSESQLKEAQRIANLGSWRLDLETDEVTWSRQLFGMFGLPPADTAPPFREQEKIFTEESWELLTLHVDRAIKEGESYALELETLLPDESTRWVLARGERVVDADGNVIGLQGTAQDITKIKTVQDTLREQAVLIDQSPDAFIVRDLDHIVQFWSNGAERIFGISSDDAIDSEFSELLGFDSEKFAEADRITREQGSWSGEFTTVGAQGDELFVETRWKLLYDRDGEPQSILSVHTDNTEGKKMELQFLRAQRLESIGTLAGGIAHDLNNVLAPVLMGMAVLRRMMPNARAERIIDNVERSANRGASLVKHVLSFARGVEGVRLPLKVRDVLVEIEEIIENTFPKNLELDVKISKDVWRILGDATQINQVLLNLCVNARDAMPNGGDLSLTAENIEVDEQYASMNQDVAAGLYVLIKISDTGSGMPREVVDRVFEPFFTTKELNKGTGLGLSTVIGIVRSHGGFVNVYSEVDRGTTFKVYLPAAEKDEAEIEAAEEIDTMLHGKGELVLLVDDEAPVLDVTEQTLQAFGYKVLSAVDGAEAIGLFASHRATIDLVITDMMMPIMDGPALIAAIHRIDPGAKIIAASGLSSGAKFGVNRVSALGVKHFLPKPYSAESLLRLVRKVLGEAPELPTD